MALYVVEYGYVIGNGIITVYTSNCPNGQRFMATDIDISINEPYTGFRTDDWYPNIVFLKHALINVGKPKWDFDYEKYRKEMMERELEWRMKKQKKFLGLDLNFRFKVNDIMTNYSQRLKMAYNIIPIVDENTCPNCGFQYARERYRNYNCIWCNYKF